MATRSAKQALLQAGYELLTDDSSRGLNQIRLRDVTTRAKVSNGAFYHSWPEGLSAFRRDLAIYSLTHQRDDHRYLQENFEALATVDPQTLPLRDLVKLMGVLDSAGMDTNRSFRAQVALWAMSFGADPMPRQQLAAAYDTFTTQYTEVYESLFARYGFEPRPPFTTRTIAVVLTALTEGLTMRRLVDPQAAALPEGDHDDWDLFGLLIYSLVGILLKPIDANDPLDVADFVDQLIKVTPRVPGSET